MMQIRAHHIKWGALLLSAAGAIIGLYFLLAYIVLPLFWRHYEHQHALAGLTMVTRTASGIPGDPMNVGLVGSRDDVLCAMNVAGWYPADPITLRSSVEIVGSVLLDRPYREAPVSHLYYNGRRQDLAFEKPVGASADRRNHVRFWRALEHGDEGRAVWLGAATFDRGVGFSHEDARVTHHIGPDIDAERDLLTTDLKTARVVQTIYEVTGIGPTVNGRNGEGDRYYTDGDIKISVLVAGCNQRAENVAVLENPPLVALKDLAWDTIAKAVLSEAIPSEIPSPKNQ
jgi:LssY-like putative type I secretion system component LssY